MPTALELTPEQWMHYTQVASRQLNPDALRSTDEPPETQARLMDRLREAAHMLKADFHVRRVILFGSLAHRAWFMPDSDVDLAVDGLDPADYWAAWREVEALITDRPVDLIAVESASPSLRRTLERHGIEL